MTRLLIAFLTVVATFAQAAEEVCGYCIPASELAGSPAKQFGLLIPRSNVGPLIAIKVAPAESVVRSNHVCTGPVTELLPDQANGIPHPFTLSQGGSSLDLYRPHLRLCDGELVQLDEYRLKPFKDFGKVLVTGERKEFLERMNTMAKNVEPEKVEAIVRKLLEDKDGPLANQRAALVTETTDLVVKLISTAQPKKK